MSMIIAPTRAAIVAVTGLFGLLFKTNQPKLEAQRLGELSAQTAKEGEDRARVYGIGRPIGGNIMYMSQPIKRMVKTYIGKAGGKGGGGKKKKQYQDVEHVYRYYAIGVCEGPITGFRRIWRNGALVYDARKGSDWGAKNNHLFFQNYRLYTGSWDQMPDSMLQSRWGMDIPAHRGTAYLVADNEDLTDFGGAIPQWQFEVVRSEGFYLTSRPYALEDEPSSGVFAVSVKESPSTNIVEQSGTTGVAIIGGQSSGTWKQNHVDEMNATGWVNEIIMTRTTRYSSMDAGVEEMNATGWVDSITMTRTTRYSDYTVEPQEMNATGWVNEIIMTRTSGDVPPPTMEQMYGEDFPVTYYGMVGGVEMLLETTYHERIEHSFNRARELHPADLEDPYFASIKFYVTPLEITITTSVRPNGNGDAGFICYYPNDGKTVEQVIPPQLPPNMKRLASMRFSTITYERIPE